MIKIKEEDVAWAALKTSNPVKVLPRFHFSNITWSQHFAGSIFTYNGKRFKVLKMGTDEVLIEELK